MFKSGLLSPIFNHPKRGHMHSVEIIDMFPSKSSCPDAPNFATIEKDWIWEVRQLEHEQECCCGSGLNPLHCHPDLYPESIVANAWRKYRALDDVIMREQMKHNVTSICEPGCNECCRDYFYISPVEHYTIKHYIVNTNIDLFNESVTKAKTQYHQLKMQHPNEYHKLEKVNEQTLDDDHEHLKKYARCPLIDRDTGKCSAYPVRPIVCRLHGTSFHENVCDIIYKQVKRPFSKQMSTKKIRRHMVGIDPTSPSLLQDIRLYTIDRPPPDNILHVCERSYPIMYWLSHDNLYESKYLKAIGESKTAYINEFI